MLQKPYQWVIFTAVIVLIFMPSSIALTDMFPPSHMCHKPFKPFEFNTQWEYQNFMSEVENYKMCINNFVNEQYEAARNHQEAAENAIEEWNSFVRLELQ